MECYETRNIYSIPESLDQLKVISFCSISPYLIGHSDQSQYFNLFSTSSSYDLKIKKQLESCATALSLSDSSLAALGLENGTIKILDLEKNKYIFDNKGHVDSMTSVDLNTYFNTLLTASKDSYLKLWDIRSNTCIRSLSLHTNVKSTSAKISPDGAWVAASLENGSTILYDILADQIIHRFPQECETALVNYHPGELLLSVSCQNGKLYFWELSDFSSYNTFKTNDEIIKCARFNHDGIYLFLGSDRGNIFVSSPIAQKSLSLESNNLLKCIISLDSPIYDIFYYDQMMHIVSSSDNQLMIITSPCELSEKTSSKITESSSNTAAVNKTFTKSQILYSDETTFSLRSLKLGCQFQSTPKQDVIELEVEKNLKDFILIFDQDHAKFCDNLKIRSKMYELSIRMIKMNNISATLKSIFECQDSYLKYDIIKASIKYAKTTNDYPYWIAIKNMGSMLKSEDITHLICSLLPRLLLMMDKCDNKANNELKSLSRKLKDVEMNKSIRYLQLLLSIYVNS